MALLGENSDDRTELPTDRRRRQARERGLVARSAEVLTAARLLAIWIVLAGWFATFVSSSRQSLRAALEQSRPIPISPSAALVHLRDLTWEFLATASWPLLTATAAILLAHFAQVGWLWCWENTAPQPSRLSPLAGLQRLLSLATIGNVLKLTLKLAIVCWASSIILSSLLSATTTNNSLDVSDPLVGFGSNAVRLVTHVAMALLTYAALDFAWQRWRFQRSLQMTREEVRDDLKELEGDPRLKSHQQSTARQLSMTSLAPESNTGHSG